MTIWRRTADALVSHRNLIVVAVICALATIGLNALRHLLDTLHPGAIHAALRDLQPWRIGAAIALTCASYFTLTFYDVLALRIIRRPAPYRVAALAAFTSYSMSNCLGLSILTGSSIRYYVYGTIDLKARDVAKVMAIAGVSFWSGVVLVAALVLLVQPGLPSLDMLPLSPTVNRALGAALLLMPALAVFALTRPAARSLPGLRGLAPGVGQAFAMMGLAATDLAFASSALFILVPHLGLAMLPGLAFAYIVAILVSLVSHVPGGVGVFEAVVIAMLPGVARADLVAALIVYRAVYYLLPLMVAAIVLLATARLRWRRPLSSALGATRRLAAELAPALLAALSFAGGAILLFGTAVPERADRLRMLRQFVPLPFVETSHIAASLAGTGLLLLAPSLFNRLDGAFVMTRALLLAGAAFALTKGADYKEAIVLVAIAALLQGARSAFYRKSALTRAITTQWASAIAVIMVVTIWTGFFSYRHVPYQNDLWWEFAWHGNASRFLRASFAATVLLALFFGARLLKPAGPTTEAAGISDLDARILALSDRTDAMLLLTGDKRVLRAPSGNALVMYQVQGRSWIVMGDPVGPKAEWADLLWRLRELADTRRGRLMLYQVSADMLPIAIDLGLHLLKYGEEARVNLDTFTLAGPQGKDLRSALRRAERSGLTFEIARTHEVPQIFDELETVSRDWLARRGQREKSFSIGRFDRSYITQFDCAIVRHEGRILAFANIWATHNRTEVSVDLMRHLETMPNGTMDYLFVSLITWAQGQGYRWFTLGLAPLSGIQSRRLAPLWARMAGFVFRHGDALYRFEGLRAYKAKFSPSWEPRYIAAGHGLGLAHALLDLQTLVGGGPRSAALRALD